MVGSWDAGIIGYFSRYPVVNLDGLANSYGYLRARRAGTEATFYPRYGITQFAIVEFLPEGTEDHLQPAVRDYLVRKRLERRAVGRDPVRRLAISPLQNERTAQTPIQTPDHRAAGDVIARDQSFRLVLAGGWRRTSTTGGMTSG